jgi:hypothetical protein
VGGGWSDSVVTFLVSFDSEVFPHGADKIAKTLRPKKSAAENWKLEGINPNPRATGLHLHHNDSPKSLRLPMFVGAEPAVANRF